jgi:hypothetical protein
MLEFEREDELLKTSVGADSRQILSAASAAWADRFLLARERLLDLAAEPAPGEAEVLERDRLASYFGCAYGRSGLLARAGTLLTLRDRLTRVASLAPMLVEDASGMGRLRREVQILRTFARERFERTRPGSEEGELVRAVDAASGAVVACADFVAAASAIDRDHGGFRGLALWAASDAAFLVAEVPHRPLIALAAFALGRVGDRIAQKTATTSAYEHLIESSLATLRRELWEASEEEFARDPGPAPLADIEKADRDLEAIAALLGQRGPASNVRARLLAELFALIAAGRASRAAARAASALDATLLVLAEGLAVELRSTSR